MIKSFNFNCGCLVCGQKLESQKSNLCPSPLCAQVIKLQKIKRFKERFSCQVCYSDLDALNFSGIEGFCAPCYYIMEFLVSYTGLSLPAKN